MTDTTYTIGELRQAMLETGNEGLATTFLDKIMKQADKNRIAKEGPGFTEEQVRRAVTASVHEGWNGTVETRNRYTLISSYVSDVIRTLREPETVPAPVEGGVYRSPGGILHRRSQGRWQMFGLTAKLTDDELGYPVEKMERVL